MVQPAVALQQAAVLGKICHLVSCAAMFALLSPLRLSAESHNTSTTNDFWLEEGGQQRGSDVRMGLGLILRTHWMFLRKY